MRKAKRQPGCEGICHCPSDDAQITLEDRIELSRRFGTIFVERGVALQLDVHAPHDNEKNWHTHFLVTTRRFSEDGLTFFSKKATDLDPVIRSKVMVEGDLWGEIWRDLQSGYFEEKGYNLRVDPIGVIPQEHLGPVRMRHHLNEAVLRAQLLQKANEKLALYYNNFIFTLVCLYPSKMDKQFRLGYCYYRATSLSFGFVGTIDQEITRLLNKKFYSCPYKAYNG